jgi:hypothetical protein
VAAQVERLPFSENATEVKGRTVLTGIDKGELLEIPRANGCCNGVGYIRPQVWKSRLQSSVATTVVAVQVGVDEPIQRQSLELLPQPQKCLIGVGVVSAVNEGRSF